MVPPRPFRPRAASIAVAAFLCVTLTAVAPSAVRAHAEVVAGVLPAVAADPEPRVGAEALARVLGASLYAEDGVLVLRVDGRALTLFAGSTDVTLAGAAASQESLSAPVLHDTDGWWLPLDAGAPLGLVRTDEHHVRGPDGRVWRLEVASPAVTAASARAEIVQAAPGVRGLQMFAPARSGQEDGVALWVSDLALAPLLVPGARAALDAALADAGSSRALLLIATALEDGSELQGPAVHGDSRQLLAPGERVETLAGSADAVGPDRPWIALAWLPAGVRLDLPLRVVWGGSEVEIAFRD